MKQKANGQLTADAPLLVTIVSMAVGTVVLLVAAIPNNTIAMSEGVEVKLLKQ